MDNVTKTRVDAAKTAAERVVQKIAETTVDLIGNKIVVKTTSAVKAKSKEKEDLLYKPPYKFIYHQKETANCR